MGVLQRFERRLEDLVEGAFAKVFKDAVQPVEIASALQREAEDKKAVVSPGRTLVPNEYAVELGARDYERLAPYEKALTHELQQMVVEHATEAKWSFVGPVLITLEKIEDIDTGTFRIRSGVATEAQAEGGLWTPDADPVARVPIHAAAEPAQRGVPRLVISPEGKASADSVQAHGIDEEIPLTQPVTVIGRAEDADVRLSDGSVSRRHAEIRIDGERVLLTDLGSTNGTTVNGREVTTTELNNADRITFGSTVVIYRRDS